MGDIISGIGSYIGGQQASSAAKDAARTQQIMYMQTRADLNPFMQAGTDVLPALNALAMSGPTGGGPDYVTQAAGERPGQMTQAELEKTPGYQWNLAQGLKATQSGAAARGLGVSGASLKGAAKYATGLADSTYQNQFNNQQLRFKDLLDLNTGQQTNLTNQFGRLFDTARLGENAAAGLGTTGATLANNMGTAQIAQGNALAQGTKGLATGIGNTVNDLAGYGLTRGGGTSGLTV